MNLPSFSQFQPIYDYFTVLATVICFAGFTIGIARANLAGDLASMLRITITVGFIAIAIRFFPTWAEQAQQLAYHSLEHLGAHPADNHEKFGRLVTGKLEGQEDFTWWDVLRKGGFLKWIIYMAVTLIGYIQWLIVWITWVAQEFAMVLGLSLAPLMISLWLLDSTRGIATRYIVGMAGLALIPLGWAGFDIVTTWLLEKGANDGIYIITEHDEVLLGMQTIAFIGILTIYSLISTVAAPIIAYGLITTGSQIGISALQSFHTGIGTGTSYALGAGVSSSLAGSRPLGTAAAAAAAGTGGLVSGAMGGGGTVIPAAIGSLAIMANTASAPPSTSPTVSREAYGDLDKQTDSIAEKYKR